MTRRQQLLKCFLFVHPTEIDSFECTLCSVKCSRRDNIRRHVRNIHSHENVVDVLRAIFQRYSTITKKTDKSVIDRDDKLLENVNNATSVIRFAGRIVPSPSSSMAEQKQPTPAPESTAKTCVIMESPVSDVVPTTTTSSIAVSKQTSSDKTGGSRLSPPTEPLPAQRPQSWSNMSVYRQLLSPYLKPSAKWRNMSMASDEQQSAAEAAAAQSNEHAQQNDAIATTTSTRDSAGVCDEKSKHDQYAIYRKILRRSNE